MKTPKPNLRHRITVKEPTITNVSGETTTTYAAITGGTDVPAAILTEGIVGSLESIRSGRPEGKQKIVFIIRDDITILGQYQIAYRGFNWMVQGLPSFTGPRDRYQKFTAIRTDA